MNIQEYIESGILEAYVLGDLTQAGIDEVEEMMEKHPEIMEEVTRISKSLEDLSMSSVEEPSPLLKAGILRRIEDEEAGQTPEPKEEGKNQKILTIAVTILGLLLSGGILMYCLAHAQSSKHEIEQAAILADSLQGEIDTLNQELNRVQQELQIALDPNFTKVPLEGLPISPNAMAAVYWNQSSNDVYLEASGLPTPAPDRQYQLWAIKAGQPVSIGVFDYSSDPTLFKMENIDDAQAFAITLEPFGGVLNPTLDQMYVLGNVPS